MRCTHWCDRSQLPNKGGSVRWRLGSLWDAIARRRIGGSMRLWKRKKKTETFEERNHLLGEPDDPVTVLRVMPKGEVFDIEAMHASGRRRFAVGRSPFADISLMGDQTVSSEHCILVLEGNRVAVQCVGAKNRTLVNGVPLRPRSGAVELVPGVVLELGRRTELLACGRAGLAQGADKAPPIPLLLQLYTRLYGNKSQGAARLGVPTRTFSGWFKKYGA